VPARCAIADGYTYAAGSWRGRGARRQASAATGTGDICTVKLGVDATNRPLARWVAGLLLVEAQSGYVASILSRRARLPGLMWDLDNTALGVLYAQCAGCVGPVCAELERRLVKSTSKQNSKV
jgi:hypothetical protein